MNKVDLEYHDTTSSVSVKTVKNSLKAGSSSPVRVKRETADIENLIALIESSHPGISAPMVMHCASLLKNAIVQTLSRGTAVNVMGLGSLYPCVRVDNDGKEELSVRFTPSAEIKQTMKNAGIHVNLVNESISSLRCITEARDNAEPNTVPCRSLVRLSGRAVRIAGNNADAGIYFIPESSYYEGWKVPEKAWIHIAQHSLSDNRPSVLEFYLPPEVTRGRYRIALVTYSAPKGACINKSPRTVELKDTVTVV